MKNLYAFLPCYNEEKDIGALIEKWVQLDDALHEKGYALTVYCIDDKSKDDTNKIIRQYAAQFPNKVNLIEHEVNKGLGGAVTTALTTFDRIGKEEDIAVLMDGDNTHDPIYTMDMLPKIEAGDDIVIASRYCDSSQTKGVAPIRLLMSWGARAVYTILLGVENVKDYTCGYRAYTWSIVHKAIEAYGDALVEHRSFACMMEVLYKFSMIGAKFSEVAFELRYDHKQGESKMRILKTVRESMSTAISLRMKKKQIIEKISKQSLT